MRVVKSTYRDVNGRFIYTGQRVTSHNGKRFGYVQYTEDFGFIINGDNLIDCGTVEISQNISLIYRILCKFIKININVLKVNTDLSKWKSVKINDLQTGDIVKHVSNGKSYVITSAYGKRAVAVNTIDITNDVEWVKLIK
jgi:hypothetical protein